MKPSAGGRAGPAQKGSAQIGAAAALMVFCVFTVSVAAVLTLGVNAYRNVTDLSDEGYGERTSLSYIWTKVKNGDEAGKVYVEAEKFQNIPTLFIEEEYDGVVYHTMIYHYEGRVYELFAEAGLEFLPEDGVPVAECESLSFEQPEPGLIKVSAGAECVFISLRGRTHIAFPGGAAN